MKHYLGIDAGSSSLKFAVVDEQDNLIKSRYLINHGITETTKRGLEEISDSYDISGVGVTGSGRRFLSLLVGADIVKTEILAHAIGTLHYYPEVRTLIDIGAEDSKLMTFSNGVLEDFVMNNVCGAGTGSVIDAIASKMGIKVENIGDIALQYQQRLDFPGKCGIFTQSSVVSRLNSGANKSDILMGVIKGLVNNYLTMAKGINLEPPYIYTGATAKNNAIVKAFEYQFNHEVIVPEYCSEMGAIGIALMTKRNVVEKTQFKGFQISDYKFEARIKSCEECENNCELNEIYENNKLIGTLGSRCGRFG